MTDKYDRVIDLQELQQMSLLSFIHDQTGIDYKKVTDLDNRTTKVIGDIK